MVADPDRSLVSGGCQRAARLGGMTTPAPGFFPLSRVPTLLLLCLLVAGSLVILARGRLETIRAYLDAPPSGTYSFAATQSATFNTYDGLIRALEPVPASWRIWAYPLSKKELLDGPVRLPEAALSPVSDAGYVWESIFYARATGRTSDPRWSQWFTEDARNASAFYVPFLMVGTFRIPRDTKVERLGIDPAYLNQTYHDAPRTLARLTDLDLHLRYSRTVHMQRIMAHVMTEWPHWNRTVGSDHVLVMVSDNAIADFMTNTGRDPREFSPFVSLLRQAHVVGPLSAYSAPYYSPMRDVVLSPIDVRKNFQQRAFRNEIPLNGGPLGQRGHFAVFVGRMTDENHVLYDENGRLRFPGVQFPKTRAELYELYKDDKEIELREGHLDGSVYDRLLDDSTFCLHLPGYYPQRWSGRFAHLLSSGCIPVIIIDNIELPYSEYIDWSRAVVRVSELEATQPGRLKEILKAFTPEMIEHKAANVRILARLLTADLDTDPSPTAAVPRDPDAFDFVMASLYNKMKQWQGTRAARY